MCTIVLSLLIPFFLASPKRVEWECRDESLIWTTLKIIPHGGLKICCESILSEIHSAFCAYEVNCIFIRIHFEYISFSMNDGERTTIFPANFIVLNSVISCISNVLHPSNLRLFTHTEKDDAVNLRTLFSSLLNRDYAHWFVRARDIRGGSLFAASSIILWNDEEAKLIYIVNHNGTNRRMR